MLYNMLYKWIVCLIFELNFKTIIMKELLKNATSYATLFAVVSVASWLTVVIVLTF